LFIFVYVEENVFVKFVVRLRLKYHTVGSFIIKINMKVQVLLLLLFHCPEIRESKALVKESWFNLQ